MITKETATKYKTKPKKFKPKKKGLDSIIRSKERGESIELIGNEKSPKELSFGGSAARSRFDSACGNRPRPDGGERSRKIHSDESVSRRAWLRQWRSVYSR